MMTGFTLDRRLNSDTLRLGSSSLSELLLMNNSFVPWFILVPRVEVVEFYELSDEQQQQLLKEINLLSAFVKKEFGVDKLNVATIGNVVAQMHVHIVGRSEGDFCWPGVVWGEKKIKHYDDEQLHKIRQLLYQSLGQYFEPVNV